MRHCNLAAALCAALLAAAPARANIFELFGAGARAQAMGGAAAAVTADYLATFHNPAGLTMGPRAVGFGLVGVYDRTSILLMPRPAGYNPPDYDGHLHPRADTEGGGTQASVALGFTLKPFTDDFAIGATVLVPFDGFARIRTAFSDEREQYFTNRLRFELVGERLRSEVIAVGLAYRLRPWISMGIGMLVLPQVHTVNTVLTPNAAEPADSVLNYNIENEFDQAITAGVLVRPLDWLRIGVTFQDELYLDLNGHNEVQLGGTDTEEPVEQIIDAVQHYTPPRLSGAIALEGADGWLITAEGTWLGWSRYLDHHGQQHSEFEDVINWRLGFEAPLLDDSFVRAGLGWSPSPVPDQTGRSNFVDNDRVTFAIGAGRDLTLWDQDFTVDLSVQLQTLLARETTKRVAPDGRYPVCGEGVTALCDEVADREVDTPVLAARDTRGLQTGNPGFPGFSSGGYLISAGVDIKWRF